MFQESSEKEMPELPDVESFRKYFNHTSRHKKIKNAKAEKSRMLETSPRSIAKNLKGKEFTQTKRHGKNFFAGLSNHKWLLLHFGMTGFLKYYKNEKEKPDHVQLQINFSNGYHLVFDNTRKLGKIDLINDVNKYIKDKKLGPDPLEDKLTFQQFYKRFSERNGTIKSALMNQKIIAGIGNIYSDEILFHADIHPASKTKKISKNEFKNIYKKMHSILKKVISVNADENKIPKNYLLPHRNPGEDCPKCNGEIIKKTIAGRSSYFCNKHQKKK